MLMMARSNERRRRFRTSQQEPVERVGLHGARRGKVTVRLITMVAEFPQMGMFIALRCLERVGEPDGVEIAVDDAVAERRKVGEHLNM